MKNIASYALLVFGMVLFSSISAHACDTPEVDPGLAIGGFSFLAGSLVVLRSRFRK